jgi:hypothetical protein
VKTYSSVGGIGGERELLVRVVVLVEEICQFHQENTANPVLATHRLKQAPRNSPSKSEPLNPARQEEPLKPLAFFPISV